MNTRASAAGLAVLLLAGAGSALAHTGEGHVHGFAEGFAHPFAGVDHLVAMAAVGWAAMASSQPGLARRLAMPGVFVATMALAAALALMGAPTAFAEWGIAASLIALAGLLAFGGRLGLGPALALVALAAVPHGLAHGAELPAGADAARYVAGFALATAALHAVGLAFGAALAAWAGAKGRWLRALAAAAMAALAVAGAA